MVDEDPACWPVSLSCSDGDNGLVSPPAFSSFERHSKYPFAAETVS